MGVEIKTKKFQNFCLNTRKKIVKEKNNDTKLYILINKIFIILRRIFVCNVRYFFNDLNENSQSFASLEFIGF